LPEYRLKSFAIFLLLFLTASTAVGCGLLRQQREKVVTQNVKLYFGDKNNERLVAEERQISYREGENKYKAVLEELIKGPADKNHRANISPRTKVYGTIKQNGDLIVDFSREFASFSGSAAEIAGKGSVVNTLTQFEEIKRVKIMVEGEDYLGPTGEPLGFMEPFPETLEPPAVTREVTLYFGKKDATAVVGERRSIFVPADINRETFIRIVLEELIKGPERKDLYPTIPAGVKILSVALKDGIAWIDFSREMQSRHPGGAAGEAMTINSIVNTLTEFAYIERVQLTVEGEPMLIEHVFLEEPVGRNEEMIER